MTERKSDMARDWEDKDEVILDMSAPYWVEKFAKVMVSRGRPKLMSSKDKRRRRVETLLGVVNTLHKQTLERLAK